MGYIQGRHVTTLEVRGCGMRRVSGRLGRSQSLGRGCRCREVLAEGAVGTKARRQNG